MLVKLVVGDWSYDGHNIKEDFLIEFNTEDVKEIELAYKKAVEIIGVDLVENVCESYQDGSIEFVYEDINKHINLDFIKDQENISSDDFVLLYLAYIKLGNPNITGVLSENIVPEIKIGGYGLYS